MAYGDKHTIPLGVGFNGWKGNPTNLEIIERSHEGGDYLALLATHDGNNAKLSNLTMQDAEALCYLLFDITQPLRDARDGKTPAQGGGDGR